MTNHWIDYQHTDVFMNIGGNTAENHPISMKWIEKAREKKGAKLIVVDPRVSRTAAVADLYVPIRPGTNIAYLGGLIQYILANKLYHEEYVLNYTNASFLIHEDFSWDDATGLFSGVQDNPARSAKGYNQATWQYQKDEEGNILKDPEMLDPNCVMQIMKKFYAKYSLDNISKMTGAPRSLLEHSYKLYASTGQPGKAGNIMYAMGITQFTHGAQGVRSVAIPQLLLGNIGIPGGGVNAQRGQANVQGACDMGMLYHILTGYMAHPQQASHATLADYNATSPGGYWANRPNFIASMLRAWWPSLSLEEAYQYIPKLDGTDHSHIASYKLMGEGKVKGMICWADNPAVSGPTAGSKRDYQGKLDWLVSVDIFENETAAFWKQPGANPKDIKTEVFILPAAAGYEKTGSKTNSGRWIQWQYKAQDPPGDAKTDLWIADKLFKALQAEYAQGGVFPDPITKMNWKYGDEADYDLVAMEINGYDVGKGRHNGLLGSFGLLKSDGSTAAGSWIYTGFYSSLADPATKRRIKETSGIGSHSNWSWAWPLNRRIVYNRCSADPAGKPWNPSVPLFRWDGATWQRNDVPDFNAAIPPEASAKNAFIMTGEGHGRLFTTGLNDAPLAIHYEPAESPVANLLYPKATYNPVSQRFYPPAEHTVVNDEERKRYPYVITTYRVCEHYQSGIMTRNIPWLNETMPELFIEISEEMAQEKGIKNGDPVTIESKRLFKNGVQKGIVARACVTKRIKPMTINGEKLHVVGMPWHWGFAGMAKGAITNDLAPSVGDPNTTIPEYKAFLCNIKKGGTLA
jgi:formate dehydrogenase major subunit